MQLRSKRLCINRERQKGNTVFKLDLEKVNDKVDWRVLEATLREFNFPKTIIRLLMFCVTTSHISILWKGERL